MWLRRLIGRLGGTPTVSDPADALPPRPAPASGAISQDVTDEPGVVPALDLNRWYAGKTLSTDWTSRFFPIWASVLQFRREAPLSVLEIGSWEGRSAIFFLNYLPHCRITCVDTFRGSPEHLLRPAWADQLPHIEARFDANLAEFGTRVEKVKSMSRSALRQFSVERRVFELVLVDGSHSSEDVRADAELAWPMVSPGGIVIFDDYAWAHFPDPAKLPRDGIDSFLENHHGEFVELHRDYQLIIRKS